MDREAFFISPSGLIHFVPGRHIGLVCSNPKIFGLTEKELERIFARHCEERTAEGTARQEILAGLLTKGWIRVRARTEPRRGLVCLFQLNDFDENTRIRILAFSSQIISAQGIEGIRLVPDTLLSIRLLTGEEITDGWATLKQFSEVLPGVT